MKNRDDSDTTPCQFLERLFDLILPRPTSNEHRLFSGPLKKPLTTVSGLHLILFYVPSLSALLHTRGNGFELHHGILNRLRGNW